MPRRLIGLLVAFAVPSLLWCCSGGAAEGREQGGVILDAKSFWRFRTVWETPEVLLPSGASHHARVNKEDHLGHYKTDKVERVRLPAKTPADWMRPKFDDSTWARLRGPMLDKTVSECWKLILMRGRFEVDDPAKTGDLVLSLTFRGGAIVYLNGEEVGRSFMPDGEVGLYTLAQPYPEEVYFNAEGFALFRNDRSPDGAPRIAKRIRRLTDCRIPAANLRKGVNVLAVAVCRAATPTKFYTSRIKGRSRLHHGCFWAKIGLLDARLAAAAGAALATGPSRGRGFKVWNQSVIQKVFVPDYPDPFSLLSPIRLTGVRNGTFAGQVVVGDDKPIKGLSCEMSDLTGPGTIPASSTQVRYGVADGKGKIAFFDSLAESPPAEVPVYRAHGGAVQPIWLSVAVPTGAKPGDYIGSLTIKADGVEPVAVPVKLRVIGWVLPPVSRYTATMDIIESPESVAMAYGVPLWSDAHLKLLDKTFALLAPLSVKTLYITCVRRTHFGNEHAMVRWVRNDEGELTPEFSIVEKYLDVATRHLGKVPGVILYCWEPPESQGHAGGTGHASRTYDRPILITTFDPETGKQAPRQGPSWGTPEAPAFWKKMTDGIAPVLKKRGMENSMLFGLIGDTRPTKQAMADIAAGVPQDRWAVHSHFYCDTWQGHKMGYAIALWGIGVGPTDPVAGYSFGWSNPFWLAYYPREMKLQSTLVEHRIKLEKWMGAKRAYTPFLSKGIGPRGLGRIGADFWVVLKDRRGRLSSGLAGRYPETAWGQLNLNYCIPYVLGKGKDGPLATVRSEAFREGLQEVEARIYLEKALLDDEAEALLGKDLIGRCRRALDERIRMCMYSDGEGEPWFISSDWNQRSETLFSLAAEVAGKYGGRQPNPNLKNETRKK